MIFDWPRRPGFSRIEHAALGLFGGDQSAGLDHRRANLGERPGRRLAAADRLGRDEPGERRPQRRHVLLADALVEGQTLRRLGWRARRRSRHATSRKRLTVYGQYLYCQRPMSPDGRRREATMTTARRGSANESRRQHEERIVGRANRSNEPPEDAGNHDGPGRWCGRGRCRERVRAGEAESSSGGGAPRRVRTSILRWSRSRAERSAASGRARRPPSSASATRKRNGSDRPSRSSRGPASRTPRSGARSARARSRRRSAADELVFPHRYWIANEHCQYLNVWTQNLTPAAKKPVMVWMHGGGFTNGSSMESYAYDGRSLSELATSWSSA